MGREHVKIAEVALKALRDRAAREGIVLDVGEFPPYSEATGEDDPTRPVRILAHAIARGADRLPFTRKISRHLEGSENRAGLASDLLAEAYELWARNTEQVEELARRYLAGLQVRRANRPPREARNGNGQRRGFRRSQSQSTQEATPHA